MDTLTAIEQRRSVKHFGPAHRMTDEEIRRPISLPLDDAMVFDLF